MLKPPAWGVSGKGGGYRAFCAAGGAGGCSFFYERCSPGRSEDWGARGGGAVPEDGRPPLSYTVSRNAEGATFGDLGPVGKAQAAIKGDRHHTVRSISHVVWTVKRPRDFWGRPMHRRIPPSEPMVRLHPFPNATRTGPEKRLRNMCTPCPEVLTQEAGSRKQVSNRRQVACAQGQLRLGFTNVSLSISEHLGVTHTHTHTHAHTHARTHAHTLVV